MKRDTVISSLIRRASIWQRRTLHFEAILLSPNSLKKSTQKAPSCLETIVERRIIDLKI